MPTIRLGDADRERFGGPEWLEVPETLPVRDAKALEAAGWAYLDFFKRDTAQGFAATVWLALHRIGVDVKLEELADLDLAAILIADEEPGKAPPSSDNGSGPTRATSASSTGVRRARSKTLN